MLKLSGYSNGLSMNFVVLLIRGKGGSPKGELLNTSHLIKKGGGGVQKFEASQKSVLTLGN